MKTVKTTRRVRERAEPEVFFEQQETEAYEQVFVSDSEPKPKRFSARVFLWVVVALFVVGGGYWFFVRGGAEIGPDDEIAQAVGEVSKLLVLPENEKPTLATVSDPKLLQDQEFFAKAEAGDKVLIYATARKAILYSPKLKKIVEIAPINLNAGAATPTETKER